MIPKMIHYCWFGKGEIPERLQKCMQSWKNIHPDFRIVRWDESNFDINSLNWTHQAYDQKMYAFVSDYVRLKALYEYGGVYLDTDVMLVKRLDRFMDFKAFSGFEKVDGLTSGVIAAEKGFPLIREYMDFYENNEFILENGTMNNEANVVLITAICKKYGLVANNTYQVIQDMHIFPKTYFCPLDVWHNKDITENTCAIHFFDGSWLDEETKKRIKKESGIAYKSLYKVLGVASKIRHMVKVKHKI
jgi:mannosyltransferase OCH1-like enzyme